MLAVGWLLPSHLISCPFKSRTSLCPSASRCPLPKMPLQRRSTLMKQFIGIWVSSACDLQVTPPPRTLAWLQHEQPHFGPIPKAGCLPLPLSICQPVALYNVLRLQGDFLTDALVWVIFEACNLTSNTYMYFIFVCTAASFVLLDCANYRWLLVHRNKEFQNNQDIRLLLPFLVRCLAAVGSGHC